MAEFQHGSAAKYVPEELHTMYVNEQGLFNTNHIVEVEDDREEKRLGEESIILLPFPGCEAKKSIKVIIVKDKNLYKQWLIDLYRYFYRYKVDDLLRYGHLRSKKKITGAQSLWFKSTYSACVKFSDPPEWLSKELNDVIDDKEQFFIALDYIRRTYDPVKIVGRVLGFDLQKSYKLENVRSILVNFEDQIDVSGITGLEPILIDTVCETLQFHKDRNGKCHRIHPRPDQLMDLIDDLACEIASVPPTHQSSTNTGKGQKAHNNTNKVIKTYNKFGNAKFYNQKNLGNKLPYKKHYAKKEDHHENTASVANLRQ